MAPAAAQNIQNFRPATGTWNGINVDGARVAEHLEFVPSLYLSYANKPLVERNDDDEIVRMLVEHMGTLNVMGTLGLWNRLEIGLDIPVHYVDGEVVDGGATIGDIRVIPKVRLFGLDDRSPKVGLALVMPVSLPTGDNTKFIGADQLTLDPKLVFELDLDGFRMMLDGGVRVRPDNKALSGLELGTEVLYGAAAGVDLGSEDFELIGEVFGAAPLDDIKGADVAPLEALLGLRMFTAPGAVFTLGAGTGIVANYGDPEFRVLFGFAWDKRDRDRDGDGIMDDVDACPEQPEDRDTFEDDDGCPDPDNDNDGILDTDDGCPLEPEDADGFEDADGCPDPDNDKDGIPDTSDRCPMQPEDIDQFQDGDGCPDPDNDSDGVLDTADKCPMDPEDKDGFEDEDGCPDPDNDKDGIPDVRDACPLKAEIINGVEDEDGCPDEGTVKVKVTNEKIIILEKVYFDTNSDVIQERSYSILNQVSSVMKAHPYIIKVSIDGHTDSRGSDSSNKDLSQRRANSVVNYIVAKGISNDRLQGVGYGEEKPIASNKTRKGRAENRRVEFTILEQQLEGVEERPAIQQK